MQEETQNERHVRLDVQFKSFRDEFYGFQKEVRERHQQMQTVLDELHDDLKLRRWLVRFAKSSLLVTLAILSFLHAPAWIHKLLGVEIAQPGGKP